MNIGNGMRRIGDWNIGMRGRDEYSIICIIYNLIV
jgi:hypothetical protein